VERDGRGEGNERDERDEREKDCFIAFTLIIPFTPLSFELHAP
jgi:hypothetical protein